MEICHLFRNFSNGANYARDLYILFQLKIEYCFDYFLYVMISNFVFIGILLCR